VLLFLGADAIQRKFIPPFQGGPFHLKAPYSRMVSHHSPEILRGVALQTTYTTNSRGIRGPEFPPRAAAYRVLCVGDSTTECLQLDDKTMWPAQLMKLLNQDKTMQPVWVGNAGQSGYSTFHHFQFLEESGLLAEVDCVLLMAGTMDLANAVSGANEVLQRPGPKKAKSWIEMFIKKTRKKFRKKEGADSDADDPNAQVRFMRKKEELGAKKCDHLPNLPGAIERFQHHLRQTVRLCREHGVRLVILGPATACRTDRPDVLDMLWGGKMPDGRYLSERGVCEGVQAYGRAAAEVAREMNVEFVDLFPLSGQREIFLDGSHFNDQGARRAADVIAGHFLSRRHGNRWAPPAQNWK
jgi:lysophospholipase L1-like esterase